MNENTPIQSNRFYTSKLIRFLFFIIVFVVLIGLFSPMGIKWYLQKWLVENGADSAVIESFRVNPFNGSVTLQGVDVQRNGHAVFANSSIYINLNLWKLLSRRAHLDKVVLSNVELEIEQYKEKGFRIASYEIVPAENTVDGGEGEQELATESSTAPVQWIIHGQRVELNNVVVKYVGPDLSLQVDIDEGTIERLGTAPENRDGTITLKGTINDAPFAIDTRTYSLVPGVQVEGTLRWSNFDLSHLESFVKEAVHPLKGTVTLDGNLKVEMAAEGDMNISYGGSIGLVQADIGGDAWEVQGNTGWTGDIVYAATSDNDTAGSVQLAGELAGNEVSLRIPDQFNLTQEKFSIQSNTRVFWGNSVGVDSEGTYAFANGSYSLSETMTTDIANISWQGKADFRSDTGKQLITIKGTLQGDTINIQGLPQDLFVNGESLVLESDLGITIGEEFLLDGESGISLGKVEIAQAGEPLVLLSGGNVTGFRGNTMGGFDVNRLELLDISLPLSKTIPVAIETQSLAIDSITTKGFESGSVETVRFDRPVVTDDDDKQLAAFDTIVLQQIQGDASGKVEVNHVSGTKGEFLTSTIPEDTPLVSLKEIKGNNLSWNAEQGFISKLITLDSLMTRYMRTPDDASDQSEQPPSEGQQQEEKGSGLPVRIDRIELTGASGLTFTDKTLSSGFSTSLFLTQGEINNIDFNKPEKPFSYSIKGNFDKYAPIQLEGTCAPLAALFFLENKTTLRNFPLEKISPYAVDAIGTYFKSGQLDMTSSLAVKGEELTVKSNFLFKDLDSETVDDELAQELNNALPVPLDLALSMLRDSDGDIDLDVPVSGKISDLDVGIADILVTAMSKAITVSLAPYLAYTFLGPTGALVYLGTQMGQKMMSTDLPDISFEPGQTELNEAQEKTLQRIGTSIADNQYNYSICAKVALSELGEQFSQDNSGAYMIQDEEARKQLFQIGETLSLKVKQLLMDKFDIQEERLLICNPGLQFEKGAKTTIEFMR